jgi:hypothetical protein
MSQEIVASVRAKYPTPLGDQHDEFLLEVAAALGKGLVKKSAGTMIYLSNGVTVSQDCVMQADGQAWDILRIRSTTRSIRSTQRGTTLLARRWRLLDNRLRSLAIRRRGSRRMTWIPERPSDASKKHSPASKPRSRSRRRWLR